MFTYFFGRDFSVAISRLMLLTFVAVLPLMGGCGEDDNPIVDDEHDHEHEADAPLHADADGFNLEVDGKVVYHQHQGTHEGGLTVGVDEEIEVHVVFIDANEAEVHLDEVVPPPGEEDEHGHDGAEAFSLGLSSYDSSIIDIHLHEDEEEDEEHDHEDEEDDHEGEEHGEEEEFHFEVVGLKAGKTEIKLQLLHGGHADFTGALLIPVTVQ
ncbi:hypothetical protein J5I95_08140 [Candidatus Poribacteria bacterium]|nr:hypothetical protein [Candidatus Poribacteria bacterium]